MVFVLLPRSDSSSLFEFFFVFLPPFSFKHQVCNHCPGHQRRWQGCWWRWRCTCLAGLFIWTNWQYTSMVLVSKSEIRSSFTLCFPSLLCSGPELQRLLLTHQVSSHCPAPQRRWRGCWRWWWRPSSSRWPRCTYGRAPSPSYGKSSARPVGGKWQPPW